jgi:hypothetical protein
MAQKNHWAIPVSSRHLSHTWEAYDGSRYVKACGRKFLNGALPESADAFVKHANKNPDWHCLDCAKAARLALAAESAPNPASRCATPGCGSYAINPGQSGRDHSDLNLCDVCYWRKRASDTWPTPRSIGEAPKDGSMVLIRLPDHDPQWTIGVFDPRKRWVDLCLAGSVVEPTHFLPLPPEVR